MAKAAYAIAVIGAILIVVFLNRQLKRATAAPPMDEGRAAERAKALAEIHNDEDTALNNTAWIDQSKGVVRLKIDDAIQLMEQEWKNPAEGRSNFLARVEKANPPPPPPAPAKPSPFE